MDGHREPSSAAFPALRPSGGNRNFAAPFPSSFWLRGSPGRGGQEVGAVGWDMKVLQFGSTPEDAGAEGICRGMEPGCSEVAEHQTPSSSGSVDGSPITGAVTGTAQAMPWDGIMGSCSKQAPLAAVSRDPGETAPGFTLTLLLCQWSCGISPHQPLPTQNHGII